MTLTGPAVEAGARRQSFWHRLRTFPHGVHPDDHKGLTCSLPITQLAPPPEVVLPLSQHIGKPARPVVRPGDRVVRGQLIGEPQGYISTALHASVTGTVRAIEPRPHPSGRWMPAIVIETDPLDNQRIRPLHGGELAGVRGKALVELVQRAGIVGLGGAAFPSHVKLDVPEDRHVDVVVLNGCECEPYLTCDHRVMLEQARAVLDGLALLVEVTGARKGYVGVEANKLDAAEALRRAIQPGEPFEVIVLETRYPQGAEKMLIEALFEREVPPGKLPLDLGIVVNNVGTAVALARAVREGIPLVERVVTVSGEGVARPGNFAVPLGTPIRYLLEQCGGLRPEARAVVTGGPMMGTAQKNLDAPVVKGTSAVLALTEVPAERAEMPCIRCGRCIEACPMFLNPTLLAQLARREMVEELAAHHAMSCVECGSCSYSCPSYISLAQLIRMGKALVRERQRR